MTILSLKRLNELFDYRVGDGALIWRTRPSIRTRALVGKLAGSVRHDGRRQVQIDGSLYLVHRIVYAMNMGDWPVGEIDHINGNAADNRIENLRDVNHKTNMENRRQAERGCRSGLLGVVRQNNRYIARISNNRKTHYLGCFMSAEDAHSAYLQAKRQIHVGCTI